MSHMVIYRTVEGKPGFHQSESLGEAAAYVERLRNEEGVDDARIYRLEEVGFSFEPYYQVRLTTAEGDEVPPPPPPPGSARSIDLTTAADADGVAEGAAVGAGSGSDDPTGDNGIRKSLFGGEA